jgi:uncharacterized protein
LRLKGFISLMALIILMADGGAWAASFDCSKASSRPEKIVCSNPQVSAADERCAELYRLSLKRSSDGEILKKEQREWIKSQRDLCGDGTCMQRAYEARIAVLEKGLHTFMEERLKEANERFTYRSKPINPMAIAELLPLLSDNLPGPVAVDVEGSTENTNRYYADVTVTKDRIVKASRKEKDEEVTFMYRKLGALRNGLHVLETWANYGGSGTFTSVVLVKFFLDTEYVSGGITRERLILMRAGEYNHTGTIEVGPDMITFGPPGGRGQPRVIVFK